MDANHRRRNTFRADRLRGGGALSAAVPLRTRVGYGRRTVSPAPLRPPIAGSPGPMTSVAPPGSAPDAAIGARYTAEAAGATASWSNYTNRHQQRRPPTATGTWIITARRREPEQLQLLDGRCTYTSARLLTSGHFTQTYGRFESRIQLPAGRASGRAFWMLGSNIAVSAGRTDGRIDVMENIGREPSINHGSMHGPGYSGGNSITGSYKQRRCARRYLPRLSAGLGTEPRRSSRSTATSTRPARLRTRAAIRGCQHPFFMLLTSPSAAAGRGPRTGRPVPGSR